MRRAARSLPIAAILAASAQAQTTVVNNPADTSVTTVFYSVCPTATSTTITLPNTLTLCPGANCGGGSPVITGAPGAGSGAGGVIPGIGSEIIAFTTTGTDGLVTEYHEYETVYQQMGSTGLQQVTYTITEACPCQGTRNPYSIPEGFTTTVLECNVCAENGGPKTVTLTTPCSTGAYATVSLRSCPCCGLIDSVESNGAVPSDMVSGCLYCGV